MSSKVAAGFAASVAFAIISAIVSAGLGNNWSWAYLALLVGIALPASILTAQLASRLANGESLAGFGTMALASFVIFGAMGAAILLISRFL